jgi:hypothetical protein
MGVMQFFFEVTLQERHHFTLPLRPDLHHYRAFCGEQARN